jgi:hypothetical protein
MKGLDATIGRITQAGGTAHGVHFDLKDTSGRRARRCISAIR